MLCSWRTAAIRVCLFGESTLDEDPVATRTKDLPSAEGRPDEKDVFFMAGAALLHAQLPERQIKFYLRTLIPKRETKRRKERRSTKEELSEITLGTAVAILKERLIVSDDFQTQLTELVKRRNKFAHNADEIEGWSLNTHEGRCAAWDFCSDLIERAHHVSLVLLAMAKARAKLPGDAGPETELIARIEKDKDYVALANKAFPSELGTQKKQE